ncbi:MAG TPA: isoprenyl transferase [Myxococcota bacterium]|nr:isoprenyl transferase [Myxococcota bacterium]
MNEQRPANLPSHLAIIMDGNGRWAESRGLPRTDGHRAGMETVREIVRASRELGVKWLTLYAFSSENWNRPKAEVDFLMRLPEEFFEKELPEAIDKNVRILAIGRRERLPAGVRGSLENAIARTAHCTGMRLVFALSYGARGELVEAARRLLRDAELGRVTPEALTEKSFAQYLDEPEMPDVDLLIRTGGEYRVSNFLLWQIAYAEIYTSDAMWPEFGRDRLERALAEYARRERRFGLTSAQVRGSRDEIAS